jgi:hypothetical protein
VHANPAYLTVILLSRVIMKLGDLPAIDTKVTENLFASDFSYLQDFYNRINGSGSASLRTTCPKCGQNFEVEPYSQGE